MITNHSLDFSLMPEIFRHGQVSGPDQVYAIKIKGGVSDEDYKPYVDRNLNQEICLAIYNSARDSALAGPVRYLDLMPEKDNILGSDPAQVIMSWKRVVDERTIHRFILHCEMIAQAVASAGRRFAIVNSKMASAFGMFPPGIGWTDITRDRRVTGLPLLFERGTLRGTRVFTDPRMRSDVTRIVLLDEIVLDIREVTRESVEDSDNLRVRAAIKVDSDILCLIEDSKSPYYADFLSESRDNKITEVLYDKDQDRVSVPNGEGGYGDDKWGQEVPRFPSLLGGQRDGL